ncbi:MAG: dihydrofolate reductase [Crocinitomicaceae bacterium]|jgi:dihydrofolate reductase|nr:dihydrofolate reductase [Crocinitomicaceae bacterium]MDG2332114.1 dihydrofolate reductase [Flavobacteriales bacterium]
MNNSRVSLIAAVAENGVIGRNNDLIWHLPGDMNFFRTTTTGHHVIMGRKNYESIPEKYRPLVNRTNIIVTRNKNYSADNCLIFHSLKDAIDHALNAGDEEPFIIGGGQIYQLALENNFIERMYLTHVHESFDGDTFFPEFDEDQWNLTSVKMNEADSKNIHPFTISVYDKK